MEQPMWFQCDQESHYEAATRNPSTENAYYNLGMVVEPHRTFHKLFATLFDIRSLQDFFRDSDTLSTEEDFVSNYQKEELNTSYTDEEKLVSRL